MRTILTRSSAKLASPGSRNIKAYAVKGDAKMLAAFAAAVVTIAQPNQVAHADAVVKMGTENGGLEFVPARVTVRPGEKVTWVNNAAFPHNIVFNDVPSGVDADAISHDGMFNAPGESFTLELTKPGEYTYECQPHASAGMSGIVIVK